MIIEFQANRLTKYFGDRKIFSELSFAVGNTRSLAITGPNGSGKSTLVKVLAGLLSPTGGTVELVLDSRPIPAADRFMHIGFVAPYLQLYDEFTAWENLDIFRKMRSPIRIADERLRMLLRRVGLDDRRNDLVRTFSSGMRQRLKYAFALLHEPAVLILDEPMSNLDTDGIERVYSIAEEQKRHGVLILATNDALDLKLCEQSIALGPEAPVDAHA